MIHQFEPFYILLQKQNEGEFGYRCLPLGSDLKSENTWIWTQNVPTERWVVEIGSWFYRQDVATRRDRLFGYWLLHFEDFRILDPFFTDKTSLRDVIGCRKIRLCVVAMLNDY